MGILAEDIERVRAATDFAAVAGEHIALRRVGRRYQGLCPFHAEKTPSFSINAEEGLYYCFGCGKGGDVITFVREVEHLDFAEAVERLAARAGIQVRHDTAAVSEERQRRGRLVAGMSQAVDWYHERLLSAADARPARAYLRSRGYDGETVRTYRLGWAPEGWDEMTRALRLPEDVLRDTGLAFVNKRGRMQDFFRGRVLFPIFDVRGDPVAFGGRRLEGSGDQGPSGPRSGDQGPSGPRSGDQGPKYRNSPETLLYSKSRVLYGLNWAKAAVVETGEVVVCEGYTDVIGLARAGIPRGVATCGTALSDDHVRVLKNFARRLVLAYDADAAGQNAAEKFYEWERRYELDLAVADLPAGTDPGELAARDPAALQVAVKGARPFLSFRIDRLLARSDLRTPGGKAHAAEAALALIREHPSEMTRNEYVGRLATVLDMPVQELQRAVHQRRPVRVAAAPAGRRPEGPEVEALRLAVHRPEEVADTLHEALFADPLVLAGYRALCGATTLAQAVDAAEPEVASLLRRLAVEEPEAASADVLARLAEEAAKRAVAELEAAARHSGRLSDEAWLRRVSDDIAWLKLAIAELREPATAVDATGRLVLWLVDRFEVEA
ncbi:MAG TPA: CHC2 zinc finger domain-containing protein [Acidimicrobiales bacterium]|nr:CHC2 zinc finger domain-containing protein [Acidimicrobiales bacterium]